MGVDAPLYVRGLRRNWKGQKLILCFVNLNVSVSNHRGCAQIITHNHAASKTHARDQLTTWIFWCFPSNAFTSRRQTLKWSSCNSSIHMFMASCGLLILAWRVVANTFGTEGNLWRTKWISLNLLFWVIKIILQYFYINMYKSPVTSASWFDFIIKLRTSW